MAVESHIFAYIIQQYPTVDVMSDVVYKDIQYISMYSIFVSLLSVFVAKSIGIGIGEKKEFFNKPFFIYCLSGSQSIHFLYKLMVAKAFMIHHPTVYR